MPSAALIVGLVVLTVLGVFPSACVTAGTKGMGPSPAAEFTFEQFEVVTGPATHQTVLSGFLLGGAVAELAVVHVDGNRDRHLRIYTFMTARPTSRSRLSTPASSRRSA